MLAAAVAQETTTKGPTPAPVPAPTLPVPALRPSDLWSIVEDTPGVLVDRVNVAGSESALQPAWIWRGDAATGASWTLDGIDVTDPAAPGSSALYLHPALVRNVRISEPGDIHVRSGGLPVALEIRSGAGGNDGLMFARLTPGALRADNLSAELRDSSLQVNDTRHLAELGARVQRVRADGRVAATGGATWTEHRQRAFTEHDESHRLTSMVAAVSVRNPRTTLGVSLLRAEKRHDDRDTTLAAAPEARWRQTGPAHVAAVQATHDLSTAEKTRLSVSLKAGYLDSTFRLDPAGGTSADPFEDFRGVFRGSYLSLQSKRRRLQTGAEMIGARGGLKIVAGTGYRRMPVSTQSGWPGNKVQAYERESVFFRTFRLTGFAIPTRDQDVRSVHEHWEGYALATWNRRTLTATAGVRIDHLSGHDEAVSVAANPLVPERLPAMTFEGSPARFRWLDVLPRAGIEWRPQWDSMRDSAAVRVALRYDAYAGPLGSGDVTFDHPGRDVASISYYWRDRNEDRVVQADEIEIARGALGTSGIDPAQPGVPVALHQIDPSLRAPRTHEWSLAAATHNGHREAQVTTYYRRQGRPLWRPVRDLTRADYAIRGAVRGTLFEDDYSVGYYAPASASKIPPGNGRILTNRDGYHQDVFGIEAKLSGRTGSVTWSLWAAGTDWRERFDDAEVAILDPTSTDGEPNRNAGAVAARAGGFGRDIFVNARWSGGLTAHAPLPAGFAADAFLHAREGFPIPYIHVANAGDPTAGSKAVLVSPSLDTYRLPALVELDLRVERAFKTAKGRLVAAADVFNVLNRATPLQVNRDVESPSFAEPREVLRPRIVRFGLTYEF